MTERVCVLTMLMTFDKHTCEGFLLILPTHTAMMLKPLLNKLRKGIMKVLHVNRTHHSTGAKLTSCYVKV